MTEPPAKPPDIDDERLRDVVPHRANLLCSLAVASQGMALLAICLPICSTALIPQFGSVGLSSDLSVVRAAIGGSTLLIAAGTVFGGLAWFWGQQDLSAMRQGKIDPTGEPLTHYAVILARWGTWTNGCMLLVAVVLVLAAVSWILP